VKASNPTTLHFTTIPLNVSRIHSVAVKSGRGMTEHLPGSCQNSFQPDRLTSSHALPYRQNWFCVGRTGDKRRAKISCKCSPHVSVCVRPCGLRVWADTATGSPATCNRYTVLPSATQRRQLTLRTEVISSEMEDAFTSSYGDTLQMAAIVARFYSASDRNEYRRRK
jgi:hypothetical protein